MFFSIESSRMVELLKWQDSGRGRFRPVPANSAHIVVVGGGVSNVKDSALPADPPSRTYEGWPFVQV